VIKVSIKRELFQQTEEEEEAKLQEADSLLHLNKEVRTLLIPIQLTKHQCSSLKIKLLPSIFTIYQKLLCQTVLQIGFYLWVQNLPHKSGP